MAAFSPDQFLILLVDDDREDDLKTIRRAFLKARVINPIQELRSGEEAIAYLKGEGTFSNRQEFPLPELILLALQMASLSGFEVLKWIREQPGLRSTSVVVLTDSGSIDDVNDAYELGADSFLVKPVEFDDVMTLANAINGYWIWVSKAPEPPAPLPN